MGKQAFAVGLLAAVVAGTCWAVDDPLAEAKALNASFAAMSPAERTAARDRAIRSLCDLEFMPPELDTHPDLKQFGFAKLTFALNGGMAMTKGGRLWATWIAGGDSVKGFTVGSWSDDGGKTWTDTRFRVGTSEPEFYVGWTGIHMTHHIANIWAAPDGTLRLLVYQCVGMFNQRGVTYEFVCRNPDDAEPVWEAPRLVTLGTIHNKPIVLRDGTWVYPVDCEDYSWWWLKTDVFPDMKDLHVCGVFASTDRGQTWVRRGGTRPETERHFTEHSIVERDDGTLHMLMRTGQGPMESVSADGGRTWSTPVVSSVVRQHRSRMSYIRLQSGKMLLVKNGTKANEVSARFGQPKVFRDRAELTAFVSADGGRTWSDGLPLDLRDNVAYPDAFQAADGSVYVSYEYNRGTKRDEILFARFREEDVLAGKLTSSDASLKNVVFAARP